MTDFFVLNALDLRKTDDGSIVSVEPDRAVYLLREPGHARVDWALDLV